MEVILQLLLLRVKPEMKHALNTDIDSPGSSFIQEAGPDPHRLLGEPGVPQQKHIVKVNNDRQSPGAVKVSSPFTISDFTFSFERSLHSSFSNEWVHFPHMKNAC